MSASTHPLRKRFIAEMLGTFTLVFLGTFAVTTGQETLAIGLVFAVAAIAAIYAFGHVSGAHLNPAVSLSLATVGRFSWKEIVPYAAAQILGAFIAALLNASIVGNVTGRARLLGETIPNSALNYPGVNPVFAALVTEVATTFLLVSIILNSTEKEAPSGFAGLAIGLILGMNVMLSANISGGSMNPARSFGPALALNFIGLSLPVAFENHWIYWVAPIFGGLLAALAYKIRG